MRILVMGGTQFNGLALVHEAARQGHDVTILNRGQTEAPLPEGINRLYGDRTDHDQMREVLGGLEFDVVADISAYHLDDVQLMHEIFANSTGHYVFASSTVIYQASGILPITEEHPLERQTPPQIEYGMGKIVCEDFLRSQHADHGFPMTIIPFSMVYGPRNILPDREQRMFQRVLSGRPVLIPGDGTTITQVGFVEDQARALVALMGVEATFGERFNLTGNQYVTDDAYVDTVERVLGVDPVERVYIPHEVMDAMWSGELAFQMGADAKPNIDIRTTDTARKRQSAIRTKFKISTIVQRLAPNIHAWNSNTIFSIDKLQRTVDWTPQHDFESMTAATYDWFCGEGLRESLEFDWTFEDQILAHLA